MIVLQVTVSEEYELEVLNDDKGMGCVVYDKSVELKSTFDSKGGKGVDKTEWSEVGAENSFLSSNFHSNFQLHIELFEIWM